LPLWYWFSLRFSVLSIELNDDGALHISELEEMLFDLAGY